MKILLCLQCDYILYYYFITLISSVSNRHYMQHQMNIRYSTTFCHCTKDLQGLAWLLLPTWHFLVSQSFNWPQSEFMQKNDFTVTASAFSIPLIVNCLQGQDLTKDTERYPWSYFLRIWMNHWNEKGKRN